MIMENVPHIDLAKTGEKISALRAQAGLSVKDLQEILGFNGPQAIYKWQKGECLPTIDNMVILSWTFGVGVDDILVLAAGPRSLQRSA